MAKKGKSTSSSKDKSFKTYLATGVDAFGGQITRDFGGDRDPKAAQMEEDHSDPMKVEKFRAVIVDIA